MLAHQRWYMVNYCSRLHAHTQQNVHCIHHANIFSHHTCICFGHQGNVRVESGSAQNLREERAALSPRIPSRFPYTYKHDRAHPYMYVRAWSRPCVHTREGMIAPMCAYTCRRPSAYVCMCVKAWLLLCVDVLEGMIVPMCKCAWDMIAPVCGCASRHDSTYVAYGLVGMRILG